MNWRQRKTFFWVVLGIILACILVAMLFMAHDDATQTGAPIDFVGVFAAWFGVVICTLAATGIILLLIRLKDRLLGWLSRKLGD